MYLPLHLYISWVSFCFCCFSLYRSSTPYYIEPGPTADLLLRMFQPLAVALDHPYSSDEPLILMVSRSRRFDTLATPTGNESWKKWWVSLSQRYAIPLVDLDKIKWLYYKVNGRFWKKIFSNLLKNARGYFSPNNWIYTSTFIYVMIQADVLHTISKFFCCFKTVGYGRVGIPIRGTLY